MQGSAHDALPPVVYKLYSEADQKLNMLNTFMHCSLWVLKREARVCLFLQQHIIQIEILGSYLLCLFIL